MRVFSFEHILLASEVEVQNYLLLQVVQQLIPHLVSWHYAICDCAMTCLEFVQGSSLFSHVDWRKQVLTFVWRILNALGKCEIVNDLHFVSAKSFLIFCLTCLSRRPFRILWPTLDNRRRFCSKNSQSGPLLTLLRISSAVSSSSIAKLSDAKSLILAISSKLCGTFLRFEIESHKRKSSIYSLWVWSMLIPLSKQILSSSGSGKEWRSSALMSWSS